VVTARLKLNN